jgi:hypothetical protein
LVLPVPSDPLERALQSCFVEMQYLTRMARLGQRLADHPPHFPWCLAAIRLI